MRRLTRFQLELLQHVRAGSTDSADPGPIDFDQLLEVCSWQPTKAAAHFSIRALVKRGFLRKQGELVLRRGRHRVCFHLTEEGKLVLDPRPSPSGVPLEGVDDQESESALTELPGLDDILKGLELAEK